jgi:hypothetical protein
MYFHLLGNLERGLLVLAIFGMVAALGWGIRELKEARRTGEEEVANRLINPKDLERWDM